MRSIFLLAVLSLTLSSCSYRAKNADYQSGMRKATREMLSVDFVDLIVEQEDENKEDFVVFSKEEASLYMDGAKVKTKKKSKKTYYVTKNESGDWVYIED